MSGTFHSHNYIDSEDLEYVPLWCKKKFIQKLFIIAEDMQPVKSEREMIFENRWRKKWFVWGRLWVIVLLSEHNRSIMVEPILGMFHNGFKKII